MSDEQAESERIEETDKADEKQAAYEPSDLAHELRMAVVPRFVKTNEKESEAQQGSVTQTTEKANSKFNPDFHFSTFNNKYDKKRDSYMFEVPLHAIPLELCNFQHVPLILDRCLGYIETYAHFLNEFDELPLWTSAECAKWIHSRLVATAQKGEKEDSEVDVGIDLETLTSLFKKHSINGSVLFSIRETKLCFLPSELRKKVYRIAHDETKNAISAIDVFTGSKMNVSDVCAGENIRDMFETLRIPDLMSSNDLSATTHPLSTVMHVFLESLKCIPFTQNDVQHFISLAQKCNKESDKAKLPELLMTSLLGTESHHFLVVSYILNLFRPLIFCRHTVFKRQSELVAQILTPCLFGFTSSQEAYYKEHTKSENDAFLSNEEKAALIRAVASFFKVEDRLHFKALSYNFTHVPKVITQCAHCTKGPVSFLYHQPPKYRKSHHHSTNVLRIALNRLNEAFFPLDLIQGENILAIVPNVKMFLTSDAILRHCLRVGVKSPESIEAKLLGSFFTMSKNSVTFLDPNKEKEKETAVLIWAKLSTTDQSELNQAINNGTITFDSESAIAANKELVKRFGCFLELENSFEEGSFYLTNFRVIWRENKRHFVSISRFYHWNDICLVRQNEPFFNVRPEQGQLYYTMMSKSTVPSTFLFDSLSSLSLFNSVMKQVASFPHFSLNNRELLCNHACIAKEERENFLDFDSSFQNKIEDSFQSVDFSTATDMPFIVYPSKAFISHSIREKKFSHLVEKNKYVPRVSYYDANSKNTLYTPLVYVFPEFHSEDSFHIDTTNVISQKSKSVFAHSNALFSKTDNDAQIVESIDGFQRVPPKSENTVLALPVFEYKKKKQNKIDPNKTYDAAISVYCSVDPISETLGAKVYEIFVGDKQKPVESHVRIELPSISSLSESINSIEKIYQKVCPNRYRDSVKYIAVFGMLSVSALKNVSIVAQNLSNESILLVAPPSQSLLIHYVSAITTLLLDSNTRTMKGFCELLEREFVQYAFPFKGGFSQSNGKKIELTDVDRSRTSAFSVFLLFLDSVFQLMTNNPKAFEFGEALLLFFRSEFFSDRCKTFAFSDFTLNEWKILQHSPSSLWEYATIYSFSKHPSSLINCVSFRSRCYRPKEIPNNMVSLVNEIVVKPHWWSMGLIPSMVDQMFVLECSLSTVANASRVVLKHLKLFSLLYLPQYKECEYLDLSYNLFNYIQDSILHMKKLRYLNLSHNPIMLTDAAVSALANLTHLEELFLENICSTDLPPSIATLPSLKTLCVKNNPLFNGRISSIAKLESLIRLDISNVYMTPTSQRMPRISRGKFKLNYLIATHNGFSSFTHGTTSKLTELVYLDLSFNEFTEKVFAQIAPLTSLKTLRLRSCKIRCVLHQILRLKELEELDLENNIISFISPAFGYMRSLKFLNIRKNPLYALPFTFGNLKLTTFEHDEGLEIVATDYLKSLEIEAPLTKESEIRHALPQLGSSSAKKIVDMISNKKDKLPTFKMHHRIVLMGPLKSGKTSVVNHLLKAGKELPTNVDYSKFDLAVYRRSFSKKLNIMLDIWDMGPRMTSSNLYRFFVRPYATLVTYDLSDSIQKLFQCLENVAEVLPECGFFLIATHSDLVKNPKKKLAEDCELIKKLFPTISVLHSFLVNGSSGEGVSAIKKMVKNLCPMLPLGPLASHEQEAFDSVKKELGTMSNIYPFASQRTYCDILQSYGVDQDQAKWLIGRFANVGFLLMFPAVVGLNQFVLVDPEQFLNIAFTLIAKGQKDFYISSDELRELVKNPLPLLYYSILFVKFNFFNSSLIVDTTVPHFELLSSSNFAAELADSFQNYKLWAEALKENRFSKSLKKLLKPKEKGKGTGALKSWKALEKLAQTMSLNGVFTGIETMLKTSASVMYRIECSLSYKSSARFYSKLLKSIAKTIPSVASQFASNDSSSDHRSVQSDDVKSMGSSRSAVSGLNAIENVELAYLKFMPIHEYFTIPSTIPQTCSPISKKLEMVRNCQVIFRFENYLPQTVYPRVFALFSRVFKVTHMCKDYFLFSATFPSTPSAYARVAQSIEEKTIRLTCWMKVETTESLTYAAVLLRTLYRRLFDIFTNCYGVNVTTEIVCPECETVQKEKPTKKGYVEHCLSTREIENDFRQNKTEFLCPKQNKMLNIENICSFYLLDLILLENPKQRVSVKRIIPHKLLFSLTNCDLVLAHLLPEDTQLSSSESDASSMADSGSIKGSRNDLSESRVSGNSTLKRKLLKDLPPGSVAVILKCFKSQTNSFCFTEWYNGWSHSLKIDHPNVSKFYGYINSPYPSAVFEFIPGSELLITEVGDPKKHLNFAVKIEIFTQVASALDYLHTRKPPLLFRSFGLSSCAFAIVNGKPVIKLANFDHIGPFSPSYRLGPEDNYPGLAPECQKGGKFSLKSDVYSFGVLVWQIMAWEVFFAGKTLNEVLAATKDGFRPEVIIAQAQNDETHISKSAKAKITDIITNCWNQEPTARMTFRDVLSALSVVKKE